MSRRRKAKIRTIRPDPTHKSVELAKFINRVMMHGKQTVAQKIVYQALDVCENQAKRPGLEVFQQAIRNVTPQLEVKSRRVGGSTYQVPSEVRRDRQITLAMRWIVQTARSRSGRPMAERLGQELLDASRGQGDAVRRKEEQHRMAEANRAFAHYRW